MLQIQNTKINNQEINAVSARELYATLELNLSVWARWSKSNIEENEFFLQHIDWEGFNIMLNGNETKDYMISLDFAKHISMQARTQKSHEMRNYFIDCEKQLKQQAVKVPTNFIEAMTLALEQAKQIEQQTLLLEQQKPQVEFANDVANTCDSISIGGYAGLLASSGYEIGQNRLFAWLRDKGYLTVRKNRPSIQAIEAGWFKFVETTYICPRTGLPKVSGQATITGKGQIYLRKKLIKELGGN